MKPWVWVAESVLHAVHESQLAEHGGPAGVRDAGLLASALARPVNLDSYGEADFAALAAAYGYGIVRNPPFVDGNKRTALVCVELFLNLNGFRLVADDAQCVTSLLALASGDMSEADFAGWLRTVCRHD